METVLVKQLRQEVALWSSFCSRINENKQVSHALRFQNTSKEHFFNVLSTAGGALLFYKQKLCEVAAWGRNAICLTNTSGNTDSKRNSPQLCWHCQTQEDKIMWWLIQYGADGWFIFILSIKINKQYSWWAEKRGNFFFCIMVWCH